jgi:hypothetical protein
MASLRLRKLRECPVNEVGGWRFDSQSFELGSDLGSVVSRMVDDVP